MLQDRTHAAELLRAAIDTENAKLDGLAGDVELTYAEKIEVSDDRPSSPSFNHAEKDLICCTPATHIGGEEGSRERAYSAC